MSEEELEKWNDENWEQTFRKNMGIPEGFGEEIRRSPIDDKYYWSIRLDNSGVEDSWYATLEEY